MAYTIGNQYTRMLTGFGGIDVTSDDSAVAANRFPYLVNMWRDWESENGAAVETVPGYRQIPVTFSGQSGAAKIHGLWPVKFAVDGEEEEMLVIHRGSCLYVFRTGDRNTQTTLTAVGTVADADSTGFSYGSSFYLLDGTNFWRLSSPNSLEQLGDTTQATGPSTANAYIPTTYSDGEEYEQRNMLTNYFYNAYNIRNPESTSYHYGLKLRVLSATEKTLAVTGVFQGITRVYIPSETLWNGEVYKITKVDPAAFSESAVETAVIASGVKDLGSDAVAGSTNAKQRGCFYSCGFLKTVLIHGATVIGPECFNGCGNLRRLFLPISVEEIGTYALDRNMSPYVLDLYYTGSQEDAEAVSLEEKIDVSTTLHYNNKIYETSVGQEIVIPVDPARYKYYQRYLNDTPDALEMIGEYSGQNDDGAAPGCKVRAVERTSWTMLRFVSTEEGDPPICVAATIEDSEGVISTKESTVSSFRYDILDPCREVVSVTLDGKSVTSEMNGAVIPIYYILEETVNDKPYIRAVILTADAEDLANKKLIIQGIAYESEFSRSAAGHDYAYDNASYTGTSVDAIIKCRLAAEFDGRIFLSGNPALPNTVFYSQRNLLGANDPAYFGQLNYFNDGTSMTPNKSLLATPSFLAVIKEDAVGQGAIYYHTPAETEYDVLPKIYPGVQGAAGVGSLGPCANFRDDPVFLSAMGLEGISLSALNSERGLYHRSSNVDKWLLAEKNPEKAVFTEWKGYLAVLINGHVYLADSRQYFTHQTGSRQYEWYFLDGIGEYVGQTDLYFFPSASPKDNLGRKYTDMYHNGIRFEVKEEEAPCYGEVKSAYPSMDPEGTVGTADGGALARYTEETDGEGITHYYLVDSNGEKTGGVFSPACSMAESGGVLFFGTENGGLFCFNTDKRGEAYAVGSYSEPVAADQIHRSWYSFNGRRYLSGFSTKKDNCDVPHYDKDTMRRSLVIKSKILTGSRYRLKVRTDREPWEEVSVTTATEATGYDQDFSNASFLTTGEILAPARESKRRWLEKQYYFYSDGYCRPFGIYYLAYRWKIAGLAGRIRRG